MTKKMPRKEEKFWKDLAFRIAKHIGLHAKEVKVKAWQGCKPKLKCVLIDNETFSKPSKVMYRESWREVVHDLCFGRFWLIGAIKRLDNFTSLVQKAALGEDGAEQCIIELELAGFSDLVDALKKSRWL